MTWPKVEEINANTNAARDEIKGNTDTAKNEIKTYTAEEIAAAIQTLQAATESARDTILANLTSGGAVKKVLRGTISLTDTSKTATISSVNRSKSVVLYGGATFGNSSAYIHGFVKLELTSNTVVTASRGAESSSYTTIVPYQVIEFN